MTKLTSIYEAYVAEMRATLKASELLLQKQQNALNGELKTSGKICEDFIKNLISSHLPHHLRLTSGYILDKEKKKNDDNLPQFDLLVVDNFTPPIYKFKNLDIEVVPAESVCAIFEIKRAVNNAELPKFIEKLNNAVLSYPDLSKTTKTQRILNPANNSQGIFHPLIGIISLTSDIDSSKMKDWCQSSIIDMIWSIDGVTMLPIQTKLSEQIPTFPTILGRPKDTGYTNITTEEWSDFIKKQGWHHLMKSENEYSFKYGIYEDKDNPVNIILLVIDFLSYMFYGLTGRPAKHLNRFLSEYDMIKHKYFLE